MKIKIYNPIHWVSFFLQSIFVLGLLCLGFISLNSQIKYKLKCDTILINESRNILFKQLGVSENQGKNNSYEIKEYLLSVGILYPAPYCAAGQYYCFYKAANNLKLNINNIPIKRTALANAILNDAIKNGIKYKYIPENDDLIVWKNTYYKYSIYGHIERIIKIKKAGWVETIGFNTSSKNQREGDGVYIKNRNIYYLLGRMKVRGLIGWEKI